MDRNDAYMLSKNLKEDEPCSVCGSEHHPKPAGHTEGTELTALEKRVENAREKLVDAERAYREAKKAALVAGEQVKALAGQIDQAMQELEVKNVEYDTQKRRLPEELRELGLELIRLELEKMNGAGAEKLQAVEAWEKKQEEYKEELQRLNEIMLLKNTGENHQTLTNHILIL